jgi:hypothetical protein
MFPVLAIVLIIGTSTSNPARSQMPIAPKDIGSFFHGLSGDWIGTVEHYTNDTKSEPKYFHALIKQTGADTYSGTFEYYRLDKQTHSPVQVGVANMVNVVALNGTSTNTIRGNGDVLIDPTTLKHEDHTLCEVLSLASSDRLEGKGSGTINISGIALGAGRNGRVSRYTSTWTLDKGVLSISERLQVTFRVFLFAKHYDIIDNSSAERGSDIAGLMKRAENTMESGVR